MTKETRGENGEGHEVYLGTNADGTRSTLPPFVNVGGVQVHPDRLEQYLEARRIVEGKNDRKTGRR